MGVDRLERPCYPLMVRFNRLGGRQAVSMGYRLIVQWKKSRHPNCNSGLFGKPLARFVLAQPNIADDEILDGLAGLQRSRQPARLFSAA
jgi:hypothetical protein